MIPIYIATKGRAGNSKIISQLNEAKAHCKIFVEPQEENAYSEAYPNLEVVNIRANDMGLVFVRNYMLQYATSKGEKWYWNLDDDVQLHEVINGKCPKKDPLEVLRASEKMFVGKEDIIGQVGLEYTQFAWSCTKPFVYNSYCDCVVCNNVKACFRLDFDEKVLLKLDRDFTIQVINSGYKSLKIQKYAFSAPKNGSNKGGLYDEYKSGIELKHSQKMEEKWGQDICRVNIKPDGRPDVKIYWKNINKNQLSLF